MALIQKQPDQQEGMLLMKWIDNRISNNRNCIIATIGPTGAGKSYLDGDIAEKWYKYKFNKEFPTETNVIFGADKFLMRLMEQGENKLQKGDLLIVEEVGTIAGSRDFMSKMNKALNYVMQTFRSMNLIILLNLPYIQMLDKSLRMLTHCNLEIDHIDKNENKSYVKPLFNQVNSKTAKIYGKFMRVKDKRTGMVQKIKLMKFSKPTKEFIDVYEPMKADYVMQTIKIGLDKINEDMPKAIEDTGTTKQREAKRLFIKYEGDIEKVAEEIGINPINVRARVGGKEGLANLRDRIEELRKSSRKFKKLRETMEKCNKKEEGSH